MLQSAGGTFGITGETGGEQANNSRRLQMTEMCWQYLASVDVQRRAVTICDNFRSLNVMYQQNMNKLQSQCRICGRTEGAVDVCAEAGGNCGCISPERYREVM